MANMIVSGAGSTEVNGTYAENGIVNDRPYYTYGINYIKWFGSYWAIRGDLNYYYSNDNVATPDLCTTWRWDEGELPAPTVTKEAPTGIPKHFLHYARLRGN